MSKIAQPTISSAASTGAVPKKKPKKQEKKKESEYQLPPLSLVGKRAEINFEEIRKKITRRSNPPGEDKKALAKILNNLKESKQKVSVQEYVGLVAPYTTDNGEVMRKVMEDDLASFRKLVTKVYENMTQDVSDVLVNEQIQTTTYYQERYDMFNERMLYMISEIFQMAPDFDFERYARDKQEFLNMIMPLPILVQRDAEDVEAQQRQEAFHRLQWLKIEGGRLADENKRLQKRLDELRVQQKRQQTQAALKAKAAESKKHDLEEEEAEKQEHLDDLNKSLGKSMVRNEAYVRVEEEEKIRKIKGPDPTTGAVRKTGVPKKPKKRPQWASTTAAEMEEVAAQEMVEAETTKAVERKRARRRTRSPHFSPIKTPPPKEGPTKERSPFHWSPPKDESNEFPSYPNFPKATQMRERTVQQTTTTVQERRDQAGQSRGPKDAWGGFF